MILANGSELCGHNQGQMQEFSKCYSKTNFSCSTQKEYFAKKFATHRHQNIGSR